VKLEPPPVEETLDPRPPESKHSRVIDGHTLGAVIPEIETQIGVSLKRIFLRRRRATMRRKSIASTEMRNVG
jgi:hypothetical protein